MGHTLTLPDYLWRFERDDCLRVARDGSRGVIGRRSNSRYAPRVHMATRSLSLSRVIHRHEVALSRPTGQRIGIKLDVYIIGPQLTEIYLQFKVLFTVTTGNSHFAESHPRPLFGHCALPIEEARGRLTG